MNILVSYGSKYGTTKRYAQWIAEELACDLADPENPENVAHIEAGLEKVLTPEMREKIRQFHLRGGIDYSRLVLTHKAMMAMLRRVMLKKGYDILRSEDQMMLDTYGGTVDFTNRESLAPLLNYVRSLL